MKKIKHIIYLLLLVVVTHAQDLHFSQFNETPAIVNPALIGVTGPVRVSVINKDQWKSVTTAYKTYGADFEMRFKTEKWKKTKHRSLVTKSKGLSLFNAGLSFYSDQSGDGRLKINKINLSLSSFIKIAKHHFVSAGLQASYKQRQVDASKLLFPDQYNGSVYDPNQPTRENFLVQKFTNYDAAAGVLYSFVSDESNFDAKKQFNARAGFALYNLTRPRDQFINALDYGGYMRFVAHGDMIKSLGTTKMAIAPSYLFQMQGPNKEFLIGTVVKHYFQGTSKITGLNKRNSFGYGLYYRTKDALVVSAVVELMEQYYIFFGYDVNVSSLKTASNRRGGFEVGLRYTAPGTYLYKHK